MKLSYNWLRSYVPQLPDLRALTDLFTYHLCEVESVEVIPEVDTIFDVAILPNRAHDLLSHQGIAKELSAQLEVPFVDPTPTYRIPHAEPTDLKVILETSNCRRYMGRVIRNIKIGPSPEWVTKHLALLGQRSINNIVDATNMVMFDCGQPCHAFDFQKVKKGIVIRSAAKNERVILLTGEEKELDTSMTVVSDVAHNVLALAGIKGGKIAEVTESTTAIVLEVANFEPINVRKTAKKVGISTDAVKRFENDVSPELCPYAMCELSALILEMCPDAVFEDIVDVYPNPQQDKTIAVSADFINKKLGSAFSEQEIENVWKRLNFSYKKSNDTFEITRPALRLDLQIPEDLVEEIGRILGYERVISKSPKLDFIPRTNNFFYEIEAVRKKLLNDGYSESMTSTFKDKGEVEVLASASDKKFLRTNLSENLKEAIAINQNNAALLGVDAVKVFEIGSVFTKKGEQLHVAFGDKKQIFEKTIDEFFTENNLVLNDIINQSKNENVTFKMWSVYPFIARDIAVWVPENTHPNDLVTIFKKEGTELLTHEPRLFDIFTKQGRTSLAFRLVFQANHKTLKDEEVNALMKKITSEIEKHENWEVR